MTALSPPLLLPTRLILKLSGVLVNAGADIHIQVDHHFYVYTLLVAVTARRPTRSIEALLEASADVNMSEVWELW